MYQEIQKKIITKIASAAIDGRLPARFSVEQLLACVDGIGPALTVAVFRDLRNRNYIDAAGSGFELTARFFNLIEEDLDLFSDVPSEIPASDRFVSINHNEPENVEGLDALKEVVAEAKSSNSFRELFADPNEAAIVLSDMEYGVASLERGVVSTSTIQTLLLSRLQWLQEKLPDWTGSASVGIALGWLLKLVFGG